MIKYVPLWVHCITYQHSISFDNNVTMCVIIKVYDVSDVSILSSIFFAPACDQSSCWLGVWTFSYRTCDLCPDCASPRTSPGRASKRSLPGQMKLPGFNKPKLGYVHDNWLGRWFRFNPCVNVKEQNLPKNGRNKKQTVWHDPLIGNCDAMWMPNHYQSWDEKHSSQVVGLKPLRDTTHHSL